MDYEDVGYAHITPLPASYWDKYKEAKKDSTLEELEKRVEILEGRLNSLVDLLAKLTTI